MGFSNINYALSEVKNPQRTIRIAGPLAIFVVTICYILANIAYFAAASKEEITGSGRLVAALLFKNVFGDKAERVLDVFVALSALGNVLSVVSGFFVIIQYCQPYLRCHADLFARPGQPRTWERRYSAI